MPVKSKIEENFNFCMAIREIIKKIRVRHQDMGSNSMYLIPISIFFVTQQHDILRYQVLKGRMWGQYHILVNL